MIGITALQLVKLLYDKITQAEKPVAAQPAPPPLLAPLYCSPAEAAEKLAARDAAWDAAAKKFGADQLEQYREPELLPASRPAAFPVPSFQLPALNFQLPTSTSQLPIPTTLAVVTGFVLQSGLAKSMVDGGPIGTPCGKPCRVGVIYVARPPMRATWMYLPCTERQTLDAANRQCNEGLLSVAELAGVCELLRRQRERMACDCQESRP